jgi:hypothetical protein
MAERSVLEARLHALEALEAKSANSNEQGWLRYGIAETERLLDQSSKQK